MIIPARPQYARLAAIVYGGAIFLWMSIEDHLVLPAAFFGIGVALMIGGLWLTTTFGGKRFTAQVVVIGAMVFGGAAGIGASVSTALLMLLKNGMHAHIVPDFPPGLIVDTLARAPAWGLAGCLIGLGAALSWAAQHARLET